MEQNIRKYDRFRKKIVGSNYGCVVCLLVGAHIVYTVGKSRGFKYVSCIITYRNTTIYARHTYIYMCIYMGTYVRGS